MKREKLLIVPWLRALLEKNNDAVFLFKNPQNPKDRTFIRFLGRDNRGRIMLDTFRIRPELEALRYAPTTIGSLTKKQFGEMFNKYYDEFIGYLNDGEWERFIESSYYNHLYQKLR